MVEKLYTVDEVAELFKIKPLTVRRMVAKGTLASIKIGGARRFRESDLDAFLAAAAEASTKKPAKGKKE